MSLWLRDWFVWVCGRRFPVGNNQTLSCQCLFPLIIRAVLLFHSMFTSLANLSTSMFCSSLNISAKEITRTSRTTAWIVQVQTSPHALVNSPGLSDRDSLVIIIIIRRDITAQYFPVTVIYILLSSHAPWRVHSEPLVASCRWTIISFSFRDA